MFCVGGAAGGNGDVCYSQTRWKPAPPTADGSRRGSFWKIKPAVKVLTPRAGFGYLPPTPPFPAGPAQLFSVP